MTDDPRPAMPSICTGGSQTAAIRIWFFSTSSPIGYSRKPAGGRMISGGRVLKRRQRPGCTRLARRRPLPVQVQDEHDRHAARISATTTGPIQRCDTARLSRLDYTRLAASAMAGEFLPAPSNRPRDHEPRGMAPESNSPCTETTWRLG